MLLAQFDTFVDDDLDDFEEIEEIEGLDYSGEYVEDKIEALKSCISLFFSGREMHCGGPVPSNRLLSNHNISLLTTTSLEDAVARSYIAIEDFGLFEGQEDAYGKDISLVISILDQCSKFKVPKENAGGMLLLYLEFCEGILA